MYQDLDEIERFDDSELTNDIVTVSKLQVALRVRAGVLQGRLSQFVANADTQTIEGLFDLLQQTADMLLEYSDFWTHVLASSNTFATRETASESFSRLVQQEQSKVNARYHAGANNGSHTDIDLDNNHFYIVVTLLMCTADDQPLFGEIYSGSLLKDTLQEITMMRSSYLIAFELLSSPQGSTENLKDEDMEAIYGDMASIV